MLIACISAISISLNQLLRYIWLKAHGHHCIPVYLGKDKGRLNLVLVKFGCTIPQYRAKIATLEQRPFA